AQILVESKALPEGAFQFLAGGAGDLLDRLGAQDCLAFTGSSGTAALLRGNANVVRRNVRVNFEADSLNAKVLGPDVQEGDDLLGFFVNQIHLEMTQKAGQKCTAVRRILVPTPLIGAVRERLVAALQATKVGDPASADVRMGPLASARQLKDVREGVGRFAAKMETATGGAAPVAPKGYFVAPTLFAAKDAATSPAHDEEVFGPVATLMPYSGDAAEAAALVGRGEGGLVTSLYSNDADWLGAATVGVAPWCGRVWTATDKTADKALPSGAVHPASIHGGPGRAGGGEELGGLRGLHFYLQRTAVQGYGPWLQQTFA
ncbi:MAG TPA: aldehyde dehydrogenase family protein, partial [Planctomycetota bacterium]|nr:aldehyde dehydrogenase family protein [Planctomycetota bacterium]